MAKPKIGKQTRQRLMVHGDNQYMKRDEFRTCSTSGCRNIIAAWAVMRKGPVYCTSCAKGSR